MDRGKKSGRQWREWPLFCCFWIEVNSGSAFLMDALQIVDPASRDQFHKRPCSRPRCRSPGSLVSRAEYALNVSVHCPIPLGASWEQGWVQPDNFSRFRKGEMRGGTVKRGCTRAAWQRWKPGTLKISNRDVKRNCLHGETTT